MKRLGIDIGSLYIGYVLMVDNHIIASGYTEHKGRIGQCLADVKAQFRQDAYDLVGITGNFHSAGNTLLDNTLCTIEGSRLLLPGITHVLVIGGQSFLLICYDEKGGYKEHSINPACASGTGSFIEQQAERLNIGVQELAERAAQYQGKIPAIATRCAVFAKSDMVHAMQEGYSLDAVCAGICTGIARNVLATLVKGRKLKAPVGIVGGVSLNTRITRALAAQLGLEVVVPPYSFLAGAAGAALLGQDADPGEFGFPAESGTVPEVRPHLPAVLSAYPDFGQFTFTRDDDTEVLLPAAANLPGGARSLYLGLDIGSTSTKAILLDSHNEVAGGFYTQTRGNPVAAVSRLLAVIRRRLDPQTVIIGTGTTGSGRKMIKELFRAGMEINEITAHARAAVQLYPQVDTIIEIGGQDSKFTLLHNREVWFSNMNYVCAAGTGSFIEEQARRLGLTLDEFAEYAMRGRAPYTSDRCTVYMERDIGVLLGEGWSRESLAAAVLYSVRDNYLSRVVNKSPLGDYIVFQGATARNKALVAAFESFLQRPVHVSPYCHLTGALGAALLCKEAGVTDTGFLFDPADFRTQEETCTLCTNHCLLTVVQGAGSQAAWGMKCGREYASRAKKKAQQLTQPEERYGSVFRTTYPVMRKKQYSHLTVLLPQALYNRRYNALWSDFFSCLGIRAQCVKPEKSLLAQGREIINSDFCAPIIMAHGFMKQLITQDIDYIFFPAVMNDGDDNADPSLLFRQKTSDSYYCYYSQYLPTIVSQLTALDVDRKLISPILSFTPAGIGKIPGLLQAALVARIPELTEQETAAAFQAAYARFQAASRELAVKRIAAGTGKLQIVILGRPYILFDPVINLSLPEKLEELGAALTWQEELDLQDYTPSYAQKYLERMHWYYGKQIIAAAEYAAQSRESFVVYLSCFRCSPDSFLLSYVKDIMTYYGKPFLVLQLDEHASAVGYQTRIEAGLASFKNYLRSHAAAAAAVAAPVMTAAPNARLEAGNTVLVPYINCLMSSFWEAAFKGAGFNAFVLENSARVLATGYRYTNGGECMPAVMIAGGVLEAVQQQHLDAQKVFFYMPTLCMPCNFPQFTLLCDMVFRAGGAAGIRIGYINTMDPGGALPGNLSMRLFESNVIASLIYKMYYRLKPYTAGTICDDTLQQCGEIMVTALKAGQDLREQFQIICGLFKAIPQPGDLSRKPRVAILGDLYLKYNEVVNQHVAELILRLGGEPVIPGFSELAFHYYDTDVRLYGDSPKHMKLLKMFEARYEKTAADLIGDQQEPDWDTCYTLMESYGIKHYIPGETALNVGRALYYAAHKKAEAIVHVNPIFCCPGVVSASLYRKIQADYGLPIIDIFYDGTGDPNKVLIPHLHYLNQVLGKKE